MHDLTKLKTMGLLDTTISWKSKQFDIDDMDNANGHNEARIEATCNGGDIFINDSFDVVADLIDMGSTYRLKVSVNSESKIGLWNDGRIVLDYNFDTQHWSMKAYVDDKPWSFCSPENVVNTIILGMECTNLSKGDSLDTRIVEKIVKSLSDDRAHIVSKSVLYVNEDGKKINDCGYNSAADTPKIYDFALPINE